MKRLRLLVSSFIVFVLLLQVSAQAYQVRVTYNTNLRASYSLESRVVETVPAATVISVVGSFNRWLEINWNGREGWMADWVPYTRVEGRAAPSDIDNCCFVDRQCASDQEWVNGFGAFQRNECPVSPATTQKSSAQPVSNGPAEADNCCFLGWQCYSNDEWIRGYRAYQNNQCGASQANSSIGSRENLIIEGSETFHIWVNSGLDLLKTKAPQWYTYIINATRKIKEAPAGTGAGVYVESRTHVTAWDSDHYPNDLNIFTIANEMIHEACHIYQFLAGNPEKNPAEPWNSEEECAEKQLEAAQAIDPYDRFGRHDYFRQILANIEDPATWWWQ